MKLRAKILLLLIPLIVLPLWLLGWIAFERLRQTAEHDVFAQMDMLLEEIAQQVKAYEQTARANVELFAGAGLLRSYLLAGEDERYDLLQLPLLKSFASYQRAYPDYYEFRVLLPDGTEDARYTAHPLPNLSEQEAGAFYFPAMQQQDLYSAFIENPDNQQPALLVARKLAFTAAALEEADSAHPPLRGYLAVTSGLSFMADQVKRTRIGQAGWVFFCDHQGRLWFHPDPTAREQRLPPAMFAALQAAAPGNEVVRADYQGQRMLFKARQPAPGLFLIAALPEAELLVASRDLGWIVAGVTLAAMLLTVVLVMAAVQVLLISPIQRLTHAAREVGEGNLAARLVVRGRDELGALAECFNRMAGNLSVAQAQKDVAQAEALAQREQAIENLKTADKLKDEFLANTSHELRTPLNGIIGISESLLDGVGGPLSEIQQRNLQMIAHSGRRLSSLVNDILDAYKMQRKALQLRLSAVDLHSLVEVVLTLAHSLAGHKPLELVNQVPPDCPLVEADEDRLQQILLNLVGNAVKFTHEGEVVVTVEQEGERLWLSVADTGIGIAADKLDSIFNPFEQADGSTAREYGGTGLGLSVSRQLVALHGGQIKVESTLGKGSTFSFPLRLADNQDRGQVIMRLAHRVQNLEPPAGPVEIIPQAQLALLPEENGDEAYKVLIVDDEPVNLQVLINYLSISHYAVTQANSGPEALALLESGYQPDVILLDVMMPRMTGYEVARIIRQNWRITELPILLLTAKNQVADLVAGLEAGANDYLTKPVAKEELLARLRTHIHVAKLKAEKENALAKARVKSEFLANMSHELRTPMNAVIGMADLLLTTPLDAMQQDYVNTLRAGGETLLTLINDILDFSKIEAGKLELEHQPFDLRGCVEEALDMVAASAAKKGLNLAYWMDNSVPGQPIGDITRLRQTLVNLLSNAVKFTQQGEVRVSLTARRLESGSHEFHCAVEDTGIGISPQQMERLFKSFSQVDVSTSRQYGGTGLGLAISKRLCELMGGRIWADSAPGRGTSFQFTFQAEIAPGEPLYPQLYRAHPQLRGKRVLIASEHTTNLAIVRHYARTWDMSPHTADSLAEAVNLLRAPVHAYELAILEITQADPAEQPLLKLLRDLPRHTPVPLIIIAPVCRYPHIEDIFTNCLARPIKPAKLCALLEKVVSQPEARLPRPALPAGPRLLLVEDNPLNQKVALLALKKLGYTADTASNGQEALDRLGRENYDVVLMDVQMPELDGLSATRQIRAERAHPLRPWIIAMAANVQAEDQALCLEAGMNDYLVKPLRTAEVQAALARYAAGKAGWDGG